MEMEAPVLLVVLLGIIHGVSLSSAAAAGKCVFPSFSHTKEQTSSWSEERINYQPTTSGKPGKAKVWSNFGKVRSILSHADTNANTSMHDKFLRWLHGGDLESSSKFFLTNREGLKFKSDTMPSIGNYGQDSTAAMDLKAGGTLLQIPINLCLSDKLAEGDPATLKGSPWELRLATKLLRERSKHEGSAWSPFIALLPTSIRLPLFFTESELNNCEDASLTEEVQLLRNFAETSFHALYEYERAGASFNDFVWALAVVYTSACRLVVTNVKGNEEDELIHLVVPFFSAKMESASSVKVSVELDGEYLKMFLMHDAAELSLLQLDFEAELSSDTFLYHGYVPKDLPHDKTKVFGGLQEMLDWFFAIHGEKEYMKDLAMACVQSASNISSQFFMKSNQMPYKKGTRMPDFAVGPDGYIDPQMEYILNILLKFYEKARKNAQMPGSTNEFDMYLQYLNKTCTLGNGAFDLSENYNSNMGLTTDILLHKRLLMLLDAYSTSLEEDEVLLAASSWEGFSDDSGSHLCETCQWQTEELSFNDYLAVQLRLRRKVLLTKSTFLFYDNSTLKEDIQPVSNENHGVIDSRSDSTGQFMNWCKMHGAQFSDKVGIVHFIDESMGTISNSTVRGVQALQDIEQGESICILPLEMGLFDNTSSIYAGADSWHFAAARLLREKARGANSNWASYISVLPETMPTPIALYPNELKEVQWWPVTRELIQIRQAIRTSFSQFTNQELAGANFEQYRWAAIMVHSRAFTLPVEDDEQYASYVLMPFMDMINHHFHYQADWMSVPVRDGKLEIVAKKHVLKGQQLFASFGPRSNDNLFLYYGFVLENNPFDTVQLFVSFKDGVSWFVRLWGLGCNDSLSPRIMETCRQIEHEKYWMIAKRAIEDYAAGITEQRPEWWNLINTWAEYGYEYMQFQPSPSLYVDGMADPSLLVALEAIAEAAEFYEVLRQHALKDCSLGACDRKSLKSNLGDLFACIDSFKWVTLMSAMHNSLCSEYVSRALAAVDKNRHAILVVKLSLALRCLEILNLFPTTIEEDKLLLERPLAGHNSKNNNMHLNLARHYRYTKKNFLKDYVRHVLEYFVNTEI